MSLQRIWICIGFRTDAPLLVSLVTLFVQRKYIDAALRALVHMDIL